MMLCEVFFFSFPFLFPSLRGGALINYRCPMPSSTSEPFGGWREDQLDGLPICGRRADGNSQLTANNGSECKYHRLGVNCA